MSDYFVAKRKAVARYDIPAALAREIGRFLVTWAYFEHYIQAIVWSALDVPEPIGRIAVREDRVTDRLDMLRDICECKNLEIDYILLKEIREKANPLASKRHLLAHSVWQEFDGDWCVLLTRGTWPDLQAEIDGYPLGSSKKVEPEAIPVSVSDVRGWAAQTVSLIDEIKKISDQHRREPSPKKWKKRSRNRTQNPGQSGSGRKSPHQASQK